MMSKTKGYKFLSLMISDDIRKEDNGKEIIIGVYTDKIIVDTVPALLPTFVLRFEVDAYQKHYDNISATIYGPDKKEIVNVGFTSVNDVDITRRAVVPLKVSPIVFHAFGRYEVHLGMDCRERLVGSFSLEKREVVAQTG